MLRRTAVAAGSMLLAPRDLSGGLRRRGRWTAVGSVLLLGLPLVSGCLSSSLDKVKSDLNSAIADIDQNSSAWQGALTTLEDQLKQLPGQASDVLAQVQDVLTGSIQVAGAETRCTVDFIGERAGQSLTAILDKLEGKQPPAPSPHICSTNPSDGLQLARVASGVTHELTISGYDLATTAGFGISVLRDSGSTESIDPKFIADTSPYSVELNLARRNGVQLPADAQKIVFTSNGRKIGDLNVEDIPKPPPPPRPVIVSGLRVTFTTHDDDKDNDSVLTVAIQNHAGIQVASYTQTDLSMVYKNDSTNFVTLTPSFLDASDVASAKLTICIAPNGNDTWRFDYSLTGHYSTGKSLVVGQASQQLDQDDRCVVQAFG